MKVFYKMLIILITIIRIAFNVNCARRMWLST